MRPARRLRAPALVLAALVFLLVLVAPNTPSDLTPWAVVRLPLELPVLLLVLAALPGRSVGTRLLRAALVAALVLITVLKLADLGTFTAFARPFNPAVDLHLVEAGIRLAISAAGLPLVLLATAFAVLAIGGLTAVLWWASGCWAGLAAGRIALMAACLAVLVVAADIAGVLPDRMPFKAYAIRVMADHIDTYAETRADLVRFRVAAASDPFAGANGLFDRLDGRDVFIVFIESYGRSSFDNPLYAPTHRATLRAAEPRLTAAGLAMRSGWLTSPVEGGQSWLAHSTLESGLTISNQTRYRALLASRRESLYDLAAASGFRTAAIMPGITMAWPEGPAQGFETILAAADLGYRGQPFNFVTMPDQYTLAAFDRLIPRGPNAGPLFAQIVLLSSHAPWVPVPQLIPWSDVGEGTVFDRWATTGDTPETVWRDHDRVREQYRQAIDYSLQVILSYAERQSGRPPLMVILGDHQPAPFVAGIDSRDVPVHLIGPLDLVADFDDWGWTVGLLPAGNAPVWPMSEFRDRFIRALSTTAPVAAN
ncbi:sulfatase-like hydrolase/transferase [Mesorhizobium sp. BR1-1-16]|uniref:sulfatase-like hydrolase/transferase n=1 Tax=Mesorhizobium sp. BR1-1-16 TaxID=2876653 RepID=UPI001CCCEAFC|nr:sulfatase-like hydrolase/transferase [Mesorhizobium sp. BR1-1-16]MBZ9939293.1 sulfatase-like hydrolase/transferase [Mesorhizobium sp. BR1-1-16]